MGQEAQVYCVGFRIKPIVESKHAEVLQIKRVK